MISTSTYLFIAGAIAVSLVISLLAFLLLTNLLETHVAPPNKWTVKVFLLLLIIISIPVICIAWIVSKLFAEYD